MIDAFAKVPEGVLSGHINPLGDYDECVGIIAKNVGVEPPLPGADSSDISTSFQGKYCNVYIVPPPNDTLDTARNISPKEAVSPEELLDLMSIQEGIFLIPSFSVCLPSTCSRQDIQIILTSLFNATQITKKYSLIPFVNYCTTSDKPDYDAGDITMIVILGVLIGLSVLSAIVDAWIGNEKRRGLALQFFMAFSLYTNIKKWLTTRSSGDDLGCVHGIRFFSTVWVVLAHTWYVVTFLPVWNMVDFKKVHEDWPILIVLNSTVAVDTFFCFEWNARSLQFAKTPG